MRAEGFFEWLGERLGAALRFIIDLLDGFFGAIASAGRHFLEGLARALGLNPSLLSLVALAVGLALLVGAIRALFNRAFFSAAMLLILGLWLLSWLIP